MDVTDITIGWLHQPDVSEHTQGWVFSVSTGSHSCCYFCTDSSLITQHILKQDIMIDCAAKTEKSTKYLNEYEKE